VPTPAQQRSPAPTIRSISLDSSVAGGRYNLLVGDDVLSDKSVGNEKQTKATISRFDSLQKLGQANSSLTVVLGTPWSETPPDLYKTLKDRAESNPDTKIAVHIDPIMEIKPHALRKKLTDLVEEDIESFLFPEVLNWNFIRAEIMKNPKDTSFFESQNLVRFVPPAESKYKCNFEESVLRDLVVFPTAFSGWTLLRTILSIDTSASASRYADMSCIVTSRLYEKSDGQRVFVVYDVDMDRYRPADLAAQRGRELAEVEPERVVGGEGAVGREQQEREECGRAEPRGEPEAGSHGVSPELCSDLDASVGA